MHIRRDIVRHHDNSIFVAFRLADMQLADAKVNIRRDKSASFNRSQAAAIQDSHNSGQHGVANR